MLTSTPPLLSSTHTLTIHSNPHPPHSHERLRLPSPPMFTDPWVQWQESELIHSNFTLSGHNTCPVPMARELGGPEGAWGGPRGVERLPFHPLGNKYVNTFPLYRGMFIVQHCANLTIISILYLRVISALLNLIITWRIRANLNLLSLLINRTWLGNSRNSCNSV